MSAGFRSRNSFAMMPKRGEREEIRFEGVGVSPGIATGEAHVLGDSFRRPERYSIPASGMEAEIGRCISDAVSDKLSMEYFG